MKQLHDIYKDTVLNLNAQVVVELGTGAGKSTRAFSQALKKTGGFLYSIDNNKNRFVQITREMLDKEENILFKEEDSVKAANDVMILNDIDILLCDSDHSAEHVQKELETWSKFNPRVIFVHDTFHEGKETPPCEVARNFARKNNYLFMNHHFKNGLGVLYRGN